MWQHVLLANAASTLALTGLIWMVQLVHYPLLASVGAAEFPAYHAAHARRISWIVAPLMGVELLSTGWLVVFRPEELPATAVWVGAALVAFVWGVTAVVQVPQHARLARGRDPAVLRSLVRLNWLRTLAWTARAALVVWMLAR